MDDGGPGVCWAIRPNPAPAGAQVSSGCRGWAPEDESVAVIPAWSLATHFVHQLCKSSAALVIRALIPYQPELTTSGRSCSACTTHWHPAPEQLSGLWCFPWWPPRFLCSWGLAFAMSSCLPLQCLWHWGCAPMKEVGGTGDKSSMTQAQFGIGQTDTFLTMIHERTLGQHLSLCSPFLQVVAETQPIYWFREKQTRWREQSFRLTKAGSHPWEGGTP